MTDAWEPEVLDTFEIKGRGTVLVIKLPGDMSRREPDLNGRRLTWQGKEYVVVGTERPAVNGMTGVLIKPAIPPETQA